MKVAVIGAGISGLSIARMLKDRHDVVVFEKQAKAGGLIKCDRVNDVLFHKVGGHVFNSKNQEVLDWFWRHFDREKEFLQAKRSAKIFFQGKIIGYPIENYIYHFEKEQIKKIVSEIMDLQKSPVSDPFSYPNFEAFLRGNFGNTLYEIYFKPYNKKIWRTDLSAVSMQWLEGKLPMPRYDEIVLSNILREEEDQMVHSSFYYPRMNGSQFIADRLSQGLDIRTSTTVTGWTREDNGRFTIMGETGFDRIVFCGDIRTLPSEAMAWLSATGTVDLGYIRNLKSNGTSNLLCETDANDLSWLYIPEEFTRAHRIIYTGNFSASNNGHASRRTCVVEFSGEVPYDEMLQEIKKLPGNLTPISFNYEQNSYVIQDHRTRAELLATKKVLAENGVYLLGRFAEWEYYNMDKAIEAAMELSKTF